VLTHIAAEAFSRRDSHFSFQLDISPMPLCCRHASAMALIAPLDTLLSQLPRPRRRHWYS